MCCAPCSTSVIEELSKEFVVYLFFYNPNIHPVREQELRRVESEKYASKLGLAFYFDSSDVKAWFKMVSDNKWATEKSGDRCYYCYEDRLRLTAMKATENGIGYFASTLTVSPYKHAEMINEIGKRLGDEYGMNYLERDFKKKNGYKKSVELSKNEGMYRQDYCGCVYSKLERLRIKPYN